MGAKNEVRRKNRKRDKQMDGKGFHGDLLDRKTMRAE